MSHSERNMVYIILGMLGAFIAVFIIIALIPSSAFDWLFKDDDSSVSSTQEDAGGSSETAPEPGRSRL